MTASERARELLNDYVTFYADVDYARSTDQFIAPMTLQELGKRRAALLAYVAGLEACVAAAREAADQYSVHYGFSEPDVMSGLFDELAALDRTEDGETK